MQLTTLSSVADDLVTALLDDAFGIDRHQRTAYLLRKGMHAIDHLSFGLWDDGALVGTIQCWPIRVADTPLTLVGPVAVASNRQNAGLGTQLMQRMLDAARSDDPPMVMIGDPEYYGRFGFTAERTSGWTLPGPWEPRRLLLRNPAKLDLPAHGALGPTD